MNLIEGLQIEINRCKDLLNEYKSIGPPGAFAMAFISQEIRIAERAISTGDTLEMLRIFNQLKECN